MQIMYYRINNTLQSVALIEAAFLNHSLILTYNLLNIMYSKNAPIGINQCSVLDACLTKKLGYENTY